MVTKTAYYHQSLIEFSRKSDYQVAGSYADSLLVFSTEHNLVDFELKALMAKGVIQNRTGDYKTALETYLGILERCETLPNTERIQIMTLVNLGNAYNKTELFNKAIPVFEEALQLSEKLPSNAFILSGIYAGLSYSYSANKEYNKALEFDFEIKAIAEQSNDKHTLITSLSNISNSYYDLKNYVKALDYAKRAYTINKGYENAIALQDRIYMRLGVAYKKMENIDSATFYLNEAKQVAIAKKNYEVEMYTEKELAQIYESLGATKAFQNSQKRYNELKKNMLQEQKEAVVLDAEKSQEASQEIIQNQREGLKKNYHCCGCYNNATTCCLSCLFASKKTYSKRKCSVVIRLLILE